MSADLGSKLINHPVGGKNTNHFMSLPEIKLPPVLPFRTNQIINLAGIFPYPLAETSPRVSRHLDLIAHLAEMKFIACRRGSRQSDRRSKNNYKTTKIILTIFITHDEIWDRDNRV